MSAVVSLVLFSSKGQYPDILSIKASSFILFKFSVVITEKPIMKTLIIICGALLIFPAWAWQDPTFMTDELTLMMNAAEQAGEINHVVANVGIAQPVCKEEVKHLNRRVSNRDPNVPVIACVPDANSFTQPTGEDYSSYIRDFNIEFVTNDSHPTQQSITDTREFRLFMHEFQKFPRPLLQELASVGGKIRLMIGDGVTQDPTWDDAKKRAMQMTQDQWDYFRDHGGARPQRTVEEVKLSFENTTEGARKWDLVSGSGGVFTNPNEINPTRIVINRLYKALHKLPSGEIVEWDQGATNLVLHEHGHALDNLYGHHTISSSKKWKDALDDEKTKSFVAKIFDPSYEGAFEEEGFAEAFSYYHSCPESRRQMEENAPKLAEFFRDFKTVKELDPARYEAWRRQYNR